MIQVLEIEKPINCRPMRFVTTTTKNNDNSSRLFVIVIVIVATGSTVFDQLTDIHG
jgi:hypothetical protein